MQINGFFLLIITVLFSTGLASQNLKLTITGKNKEETTLIETLGYQKKHLDYQSILSEMDSVQHTLYKLGYIENKLESLVKGSDSTFTSKMHLKRKFDTIYIYTDFIKTLRDPILMEAISPYVEDRVLRLPLKDVENTLSVINSRIAKNGFPFTALKLSDIEVDHNTLRAELLIDLRDKKRTINAIIIKDYEKFPKSYLKYYLKLRPNQTFDLASIKSKTERLDNLKFANQIKPPEVLFSNDSTQVYLYITKVKSNNFEGFLGFGTNEDTGNIEFDGYLNLNLTNNLNYGETFRLLYKSDENDQKTFNAQVSMPYIFKTAAGLDMQLHIFKRDSSFTNANQSFRLHYQINPKNKIYTGFNSTTSNNLLTTTTSSITDLDANYFSLAYEYLNLHLQDVLFPVHTMLYMESNFGKRKTSDISENQSKFLIDAFRIFSLNDRNSLFFRINGATVTSDHYFENELLRFGGITSIRGFEENSLYANFFGLLNTEYRFRLSQGIYVHSIIDAAYFENDITRTKEKLFGFGFGFGLFTKSGVFKFIYANGKAENQNFKLSNSKVHLSLTTAF